MSLQGCSTPRYSRSHWHWTLFFCINPIPNIIQRGLRLENVYAVTTRTKHRRAKPSSLGVIPTSQPLKKNLTCTASSASDKP